MTTRVFQRHQDLFLPIRICFYLCRVLYTYFVIVWSVIAAYILSYQQKNKVRFNNKHTVSNENKTERLMSRYLRSLPGYSELLFTFAHLVNFYRVSHEVRRNEWPVESHELLMTTNYIYPRSTRYKTYEKKTPLIKFIK